MSIKWSDLIKKMSEKCSYKTSHDVISIEGDHPNFRVVTSNNSIFSARNVVLATTVSSINDLLGYKIYDNVVAHPFMRIFASFDDKNTKLMNKHYPKMVITHNRSHFIIPMGKNVWMLAYTDGDDANYLHETIKDKTAMESYMNSMMNENIKISELKIFYWQEGTHYYKPGNIDFKNIRNPEDGIYVIGESVARRQGWCGGALESVEEVLNFIY